MSYSIAEYCFYLFMWDNSCKKRPIAQNTYHSPSDTQSDIHSTKSEPNEFASTRIWRASKVFQHVITEMPARKTSYSFTHSENKSEQLHKNFSVETHYSKLWSKAIIHDSFSNYLAKNYKTFRIGVNTIAIKKKMKFQKDGVGQLASNIAQAKPISFKVRVEPQPENRKAYLEQEQRARHECSQLNQWSKKLQILERVQTNRLLNPKKQQLPGITSRKKRKSKNQHFKPWSHIDEPHFASKYPAVRSSSYQLYDIIE